MKYNYLIALATVLVTINAQNYGAQQPSAAPAKAPCPTEGKPAPATPAPQPAAPVPAPAQQAPAAPVPAPAHPAPAPQPSTKPAEAPCPPGAQPAPAPAQNAPAGGNYGGNQPSASPAGGNYGGAQPAPAPAQNAPAYGAPALPPKECKPRSTSCDNSANSTCPCVDYGAILFEQEEYAGIKHWVDGKSGECRGLNGTDIHSVSILTGPGGDAIYSRAKLEYANGVTLTFYDEFNCGGKSLLQTTGHQPYVQNLTAPALSVKISCNGNGTFAANNTQPPGQNFPVVVTDENNFGGEKHWTDGRQYECRGLSGVNVGTIQYVKSPGADPTVASNLISDEEAKQLRLVFFDGYGCIGNKTAEYIGNQKSLCQGSSCPQPKSVMFMSADKSKAPVTPHIPGIVENTTAPAAGGNNTGKTAQAQSFDQASGASSMMLSGAAGSLLSAALFLMV
ncbi:hypothetical protein MP228_011098 [Amoeboaphelidium protococcarum]|nr:hypothetical protein MP228_011098 [Amoeboaphelidium protococcarum]